MVGTKLKIMKKIFITLFFISGLLLVSCENDSTANLSKVTNYPNVTLNGDRTIFLAPGDPYIELGAKSTAGSATLPVTITGTVDVNKTGVYKINYESFNSDGFSASKTRAVVVMSKSPSAINLAGTFVRNGANVNVVTRLSDRKYMCTNAGGLAGPYSPTDDRVTLIFYNLDDTKIYAPFQENTSPTGISAETSVGSIVSVDKFTWTLFASAVYGTSLRTFTRQ
jgi:hypothetical protein